MTAAVTQPTTPPEVVKESRQPAEETTMGHVRSARSVLLAVAGTVLVAGCSSSSGSATPSASDAPLGTPSPANPSLAAALLTPKDLPTGWKYILFNGPDALDPHSCDTGAAAAAKVGLQSGAHVVVEDGTLFDTTDHASAFIKREAKGADCARAATASPAAQTDLGLAPVGDESYSFKSQGSTCDQLVLIRKAVVVVEVVTPCAETSADVSTFVAAAVKALAG